jgi:hypothetical protein
MKRLIIVTALLLMAAECLPQYRIGTGKSNITPAGPGMAIGLRISDQAFGGQVA